MKGLVDDYLSDRGFDPRWLRSLGVRPSTHDDHFGEGYVRFKYPHLQGEWAPRYRNIDPDARPRYRNLPGEETHIYNPMVYGPSQRVLWIAEGEFDTLALLNMGIPAVGAPGANTFHPMWGVLFSAVPHIVLAFDGDDAGRKAAQDIHSKMPNSIVFDTPDGMDMNDLMLEGDDEMIWEFHEALS